MRRENTRRKQVMKFYNTLSQVYNEVYRTEQQEKVQSLLELDLSVSGILMDLGCGTGIALESFNTELAIGLDISIDMIKLAAGGNAELILSDATQAPIRDECIHTMLIITSFHHFPYKIKALKEIIRMLRFGGVVGISLLKVAGASLHIQLFDNAKELSKIKQHEGAKDIIAIYKKISKIPL
ncbi:MAG: class I SAM-dependent methyltransferase [Conexivisphaerales archaeon]